MKALLLFIVSVSLVACSKGGDDKPTSKLDPDAKVKLFIEANYKDKVKALLKDPGSAEFSNVTVEKGSAGIYVACGSVNAKNSFGGYTGASRFVSNGHTITVLESMVSDFDNLWAKFC